MSIYGDLSKAQRALLQDLFHGSFFPGPEKKGRLCCSQAKRAVSIETAVTVDRKGRQTAGNLRDRGLVAMDETWGWRPRVWLTPAGQELMRSLDYSHVGGSRRRRIARV